jgi:hypothetical protein
MDVTTDDLHDSEVYQQLCSRCLVREGGVCLWAMVGDGL